MTYRPPRLGDLMHARLGDGHEYTTMLESISDDGNEITLSGPVDRRDLIVVIRRVGAREEPAPWH